MVLIPDTIRTLLCLAVFAELSVLTRALLAQFIYVGCRGGWGPCPEDNFYFTDLPANILGSFIIGVFAASTTIGLANEKPLALLPKQHPWQSNFPLQIGIRTGYCGSLTTFSAWIVQLMTGAILNNTWFSCVLGLITGLFAALVAYIIGTHAALFVDRFLLSDKEDVLLEQGRYRLEEIRTFRGESAVEEKESATAVVVEVENGFVGLSELQEELQSQEYDLPRIVSAEIKHRKSGGSGAKSLEISSSAAAAAAAASNTGGGVVLVPELQQDTPALSIPPPSRHTKPQHLLNPKLTKTDVCVCIGLFLLTSGAALGAILETRHVWLRQSWFAILMAPFGCVLRYHLSRLNYKSKGKFHWAPTGTFLANMLGTAVSSAMAATQLRGDLGYWGTMMTGSVSLGFCGALSTVSTFVTEIVKFLEVFPDAGYAYSYGVGSVVGGIGVVCAVYGWAVWAY